MKTMSHEKICRWIGNVLFTLLILAIMLDPTDTVTHLKGKFFILLVGFSAVVYTPDWKYLVHILLVYAVVTITYIFAELQMNIIDYDRLLAVYKAFSPLVMLLWIRHYDVIRLSIFPAIIACLMIFVLFIVACSSEVLEYGMFLFFSSHDDMVMMSHRYFFGIKIFGMYLKSFVSLMFAMFIMFYYMFNASKWRKRILYAIGAILFTVSFLVSGTRSTMLLPFAMFGVVSYGYIARTRFTKYFTYPLLALFAFVFLAIVLLLASETGELSNEMKYAHLASYTQLFTSHPEYLIFGQGPATKFYTLGFRRFTDETEWTYLELIRNYGVFCIAILLVVLWPLFKMIRKSNDVYKWGITTTYFIYLMIAGTNPLLLSSTGMIIILMAYSFVERMDEIGPKEKT